MKKILLMSVILVLGLTLFGQSNNVFSREELNERYKTYIDHNYRPLNFHEWLITNHLKVAIDSKTISSGNYLIKAKKQFVDGFIFEAVAGGAIFYGKYQYRNYSGVSNGNTFRVVKGEKVRNICYMSAGALGLTGLIFDLSAIGNIGKAGISLDENGIGINIKF
jgi:hypothetical protein